MSTAADTWICPKCGKTTDEPAFVAFSLDMGVYCPSCPEKVELDVNPEWVAEKPNCPLESGLRPCGCDLPRCPLCGYTRHDAAFEGDHGRCEGAIPEALAAEGRP